jgi:exosortase/archaeosortase
MGMRALNALAVTVLALVGLAVLFGIYFAVVAGLIWLGVPYQLAPPIGSMIGLAILIFVLAYNAR